MKNKRISVLLLMILCVLLLAACIPTDGKTPAIEHPKSPWQVLGAGAGGAFYNPTVSPHDTNIVMTRCDMTNSFISYDGGKSFRQIKFHQNAWFFYFDPYDPNIIYVCSDGLWRSEDQGESFEEVLAGTMAKVACGPDGAVYAVLTTGEIWQSQDFGKTFPTRLTSIPRTGMESARVLHISVDATYPADAPRLMLFTDTGVFAYDENMEQLAEMELIDAASFYDAKTKSMQYYVIRMATEAQDRFHTEVAHTTDGENFQVITAGCADLASSPHRYNFGFLGVHDTSTIYVTLQRGMSEQGYPVGPFGAVKTTDGGETWALVYNSGSGRQPKNLETGWLEDVYMQTWTDAPMGFGASTRDPDICYITNMGAVYRTTDGGQTWQQIYCTYDPETKTATSTGLDVQNVYTMRVDPFNPNRMFMACTDVGGFISEDGGESWMSIVRNGIAWMNTCYDMVFDPAVEGRCWSVWSTCHDLPFAKMFRTDPELAQYSGGVAYSEDGGVNWTSLTDCGLPKNAVPTSIIVDPNSPADARVLYTTVMNQGVFKSIDGGQGWLPCNNGLEEPRLRAWRLTLSPNGRTIYLIMTQQGSNDELPNGGALYKTANGGERWDKLPMPGNVPVLTSISIVPDHPTQIYASGWAYGKGYSLGGGGVWLSQDSGKTWRNVFDASVRVEGVHVDSRDSEVVYIATFDGRVLVSRDGTMTWKECEKFEFQHPKSVLEDPNDPNMIYVTTFGGGLWYGRTPFAQ